MELETFQLEARKESGQLPSGASVSFMSGQTPSSRVFQDVRERPSFLPSPLLSDVDLEAEADVRQEAQGRRQLSRCFCKAHCFIGVLVIIPFAFAIYRSLKPLLPEEWVSRVESLVDLHIPWQWWIFHVLSLLGAVALLLAHAVCILLISLWAWADLPASERILGQWVVNKLVCSKWTCLGLIALLSFVGPDRSVTRRLALVYFLLVMLIWIYRKLTGTGVRRTLLIYGLGLPMLARYHVLAKWADYANMSEDELSLAYSSIHSEYAPRIFTAAVALGGIWVKMGQKLTAMPILPPEYHSELKKLQNAVPPRPCSLIRRIISRELRKPIDKLFSTFDEKPLGAASIGQVHSATLLSGEQVVIKVQYPELKDTLSADLNMFAFFMRLQGQGAAAEVVRKSTLEELDFLRESRTLDQIHRNLKDHFPDVQTPIPVQRLCTESVLVMTTVSGISLMDAAVRMMQTLAKMMGMGDLSMDEVMQKMLDSGKEAPDSADKPKKEWRMLKNMAVALDMALSEDAKAKLLQKTVNTGRVAANVGVALYNNSAARFGAAPLEAMPSFDMVDVSTQIWKVFGHSIFVDGFVNADPHPGNILVDDKTGRLGLIDFGQTIEVSVEMRVKLARVIVAVAKGDEMDIAQTYAQMGVKTKRMNSKLIAMMAGFHFGAVQFSPQSILDLKAMVEEEGGDPDLGEALVLITAIIMLRGSSMCLGTMNMHYPAAVWLDLARDFIESHGADFPVGSPIDLDLHGICLETSLGFGALALGAISSGGRGSESRRSGLRRPPRQTTFNSFISVATEEA